MTLSLLPEDQKIHEDDENIVNRSIPRVYFVNENGIYMSVFREVISGTKVINDTGRMKIEHISPLFRPYF